MVSLCLTSVFCLCVSVCEYPGSYTATASLIDNIFLVSETLFFGLFTGIMSCSQVSAIMTDETVSVFPPSVCFPVCPLPPYPFSVYLLHPTPCLGHSVSCSCVAHQCVCVFLCLPLSVSALIGLGTPLFGCLGPLHQRSYGIGSGRGLAFGVLVRPIQHRNSPFSPH